MATATATATSSAPLDDSDQYILQEAQSAGLVVEATDEITVGGSSKTSAAAAALFLGRHSAQSVRVYRVRAANGMSWTYTQPYSSSSQMPGTHEFTLQGALAAPVKVTPRDKNWRRLRFKMLMIAFCGMLTFVFGIGLVLAFLLTKLFPYYPKFRSTNAETAKWIGSQRELRAIVRRTQFGWFGFLGVGGWKLPWIIQLFSLGDGTSQLLIKAPEAGKASYQRWRVGFAQAMAIANEFQRVLPRDANVPAQQPM